MTSNDAQSAALDLRTAAARIGISVPGLRRLLRAGALPHVRVGRRVLMLPGDISDFLLAHRVGAATIPAGTEGRGR